MSHDQEVTKVSGERLADFLNNLMYAFFEINLNLRWSCGQGNRKHTGSGKLCSGSIEFIIYDQGITVICSLSTSSVKLSYNTLSLQLCFLRCWVPSSMVEAAPSM